MASLESSFIISEVVESSIRGYEWPIELANHAENLENLDRFVDLMELKKLINGAEVNNEIILTFLSKEYLNIGLIWISCLRRAGLRNFIVFAFDRTTYAALNRLDVPVLQVTLTTLENSSASYLSPAGFSSKGLGITSLKFPAIKFIIEQGINVLFADIDALILKDKLQNDLKVDVDIAFQRIVYFPRSVVTQWGFAACSGFVWFRSTNRVSCFLRDVVSFQQQVHSDQIALNVALFSSKVIWKKNGFTNSDSDERHLFVNFEQQASKSMVGQSLYGSLKVQALAPMKYWRNSIVPLDYHSVVVFHPNSPKNETGKLKLFSSYGLDEKGLLGNKSR